MSKLVSLRIDDELVAWAEAYAKQRGSSRSAVLEEALRSFRQDCEGGVPDLPAPESLAVREARAKVNEVQRPATMETREELDRARQAALNAAKYRALGKTS